MSFLETPRFPDRISFNMESGPTWSTRVVILQSGREQRNIEWSAPRMRYNVATAINSVADREEIIAWMRCLRGQAHGFRIKDPIDFSVDSDDGYINEGGVGNGTPTGQLYKYYSIGALSQAREITKPVSGTVTFYMDSTEMISPAPSLDTTTGVVTFMAEDSASVMNACPATGGATTLTLDRALSGLSVGDKIYLVGISGTIGNTLNGAAHTVQAISASPPIYDLATDTDGLSYTSGGTAAWYPQARHSLRWVGEFDVPVRFETDSLRLIAKTTDFQRWPDIPIVEIRV